MVAKSRDQFEVLFLNMNGIAILEFNSLREFLLAVDLGTEIINNQTLIHKTNSIILWFQDDINSIIHQIIRSWVERGNDQFKIIIKTGKDVYEFNNAEFNAIQHSLFSREDNYQTLTQVGGIKPSAIISPPINNMAAAKLVQIAFSEMNFYISQ